MSIFGKAWGFLKDARKAVHIVADVGDAVASVLGISKGTVAGRIVGEAKKADEAIDKVEDAAKGAGPQGSA